MIIKPIIQIYNFLQLFISYNSLYIAKKLLVNISLFFIVSTCSTIFSYILTVYLFNSTNRLSKCVKQVFVIIKTLPLLLQLQLGRELLQYFFSLNDSVAIVLILTINSVSYMSYILLEGFNHIDQTQINNLIRWEIPTRTIWFNVLMKSVFKNIHNALMNEYVNILKDTVIVGYVGIQDAQQTINILSGRYLHQTNGFQIAINMLGFLGFLFYLTHIVYSRIYKYHLYCIQKIISILSY